MNLQRLNRLPVDPRVVERIQKSPTMMAEQGSGFMESWEGPSSYRELSGLPKNDRLVYAAILGGTTTQDQIEIVTGLSASEVSKSLSALKRKGKVAVEVGAPEQII